ncbi:SMP-30/gluconolactonase/LRE family protein [Rheinheimera texasensis]|uniref:SMP-30/gluconolactonase/LRE family protein n=1 Tax=Rheinheimera texasensis TaxID=306205 RepID=UPI000B232BB3|nr:SMP-30/gluconolactonase/LRE family protein [Rheinheimera texasensis]
MALFRPLCLITTLLMPFAGVTEEQAAGGWPAELPQQPVEVRDAALLQVIDATAKLEILSTGHQWAEGPVAEPGNGAVLFSDVPKNQIWRWSEATGSQLYMSPSGATGFQPSALKQGSNGLIFNKKGELVLAQHGDRRLAIRTAQQGQQATFRTLIGNYQGKVLNSPNDLIELKDGRYLFTDPPYGLKGGDQAADKQQTHNGVYQLTPDGVVSLISSALTRPNGLAVSPDEQFLYVANSDPKAAQWWRFQRSANGQYQQGVLWLDVTAEVAKAEGLPDGLKVLPNGILLATGPGGVWVINAAGKVLGLINTGVAAANVALSEDGHYLYITASQYLLRIKLRP